MPAIKIDEDAHRILKTTKQTLRKTGINATFSDAIRWLYGKSKSKKDND